MQPVWVEHPSELVLASLDPSDAFYHVPILVPRTGTSPE